MCEAAEAQDVAAAKNRKTIRDMREAAQTHYDLEVARARNAEEFDAIKPRQAAYSDAASLTGRINETLDSLGGPKESTTQAVAAGHPVLDSADEQW